MREQLISQYSDFELEHILSNCRSRLQRLRETMARKSKRLALKAKENLDTEMMGLRGFEHDVRVGKFLQEAAAVISDRKSVV